MAPAPNDVTITRIRKSDQYEIDTGNSTLKIWHGGLCAPFPHFHSNLSASNFLSETELTVSVFFHQSF